MLSVIVTKQITSVSVFHASFQLFTNYEFCHDIVKVAVDVKLSAFSGWVDIAEIINSCVCLQSGKLANECTSISAVTALLLTMNFIIEN